MENEATYKVGEFEHKVSCKKMRMDFIIQNLNHYISDKEGCKHLLNSKRLKTVKKIWVDAGYRGEELQEMAKKNGKELEVVKRPPGRIRIYNDEWKVEWIPIERAFTLLPRRWVVQRTFA